jgi:hypothetical protein
MPDFSSLVNGVIQIVLTMQSYFVRLAGMAGMLRTSSSGFTVRLAQSREEPARLQIVIIDALMNFEQLGAQSERLILHFVSYFPTSITYPTMTVGDAHINRHYL